MRRRRTIARAHRRPRGWVAATALAPALLLPAALLGSSTPAPHPTTDTPALRELGVSGNLPQTPQLSPRLLRDVGDPRALATPSDPAAGAPQLDLPHGDLGIPAPVLAAYVGAAREVAVRNPDCHLDWSVLASIGRIESGHAHNGDVDANGTTAHAILGPRLSGGPDVAAVPDSDGGRFDGDPVWDRAVGPMQFIPATWSKYAVDANHDGVASPHNVNDATAAAGDYLCAGRSGLDQPVALAQAVFSYNHSEDYVRTVLIWADAYRTGVTPTQTEFAPEVDDVLAGARLPKDAPAPDVSPLPIPNPQELRMIPPQPRPEPQPLAAGEPATMPPSESAATAPPAAVPPAAEQPAEPTPPEVSIQPLPPVQVPPPSQPTPQPSASQPAPAQPPSQPADTPTPQPTSEPSASQQPTPEHRPATQPPVTSSSSAPPSPDVPPVAPAPPSPTSTSAPPSSSSEPTPSTKPSVEPNSAPTRCDPRIVQAGAFTEGSPGPGVVIKPGTTNPNAVVPGQPVFTNQGVCVIGKL